MIIRSHAPLRIGIGGGGTDLEEYSSKFGGAVVNTTIQKFAHCIIRAKPQNQQIFYSSDSGQSESANVHALEAEKLPLHQNVFRKLTELHGILPGFELETFCDVPAGTGMGSSSACIVAQLAAYSQWLGLNYSQKDIAQLAYQVEREDMGLSGGKQDQWASAIGGFNYLEFTCSGEIKISPVLMDSAFREIFESRLLLFYTGVTRDSSLLSEIQSKNAEKDFNTIESLHTLKTEAIHIRELLQRSDIFGLAEAMKISWRAKRKLAEGISNQRLDIIYNSAMDAGAMAGKVLGAGGGGFMLFLVEPHRRESVLAALENFSGHYSDVKFSHEGVKAFTYLDQNPEREMAWNHTL